MKVDYEELMGFYKAFRYGRPGDGEYEDAIESMIDAVPDIVRERKEIEAENRALRERVQTLEKMVDYLAEEFSDGDDQSDCNHTHLACQYRGDFWCHAGREGQKQCWIRVAEQAAKETRND